MGENTFQFKKMATDMPLPTLLKVSANPCLLTNSHISLPSFQAGLPRNTFQMFPKSVVKSARGLWAICFVLKGKRWDVTMEAGGGGGGGDFLLSLTFSYEMQNTEGRRCSKNHSDRNSRRFSDCFAIG